LIHETDILLLQVFNILYMYAMSVLVNWQFQY